MVNIDRSRRSNNYWTRAQYGHRGRPTEAILHWWGRPIGQGPESILSWLCRPGGDTSAHAVISGNRVWEIIDPALAAFHSGSTKGNGAGIGIEIDPNLPAGTMETVAQYCAQLERRYGSLNYSGHRDWSSTECPGVIYNKIPWVISRVNQILAGGGSTAPAVAGLILPCGDARVSQNYGDKATGYNVTGHTGTDFAVNVGTSVKAAGDGTVLWADWAANLAGRSWANRWYLVDGAGIVVVVDHGDFLTVYAHLNSTALNTGNRVSRGQEIGKSGSTGNSTGPHLHFEVIPKPFNWNNTFRGEGGYYGRVDPVAFVKNRQGAQASASVPASNTTSRTGDWFDMATQKDLEVAVNTVMQQSKGLIKQCVHEVLHNENLRREGSVNGKAVGGTTTFGLEARYNAQNFGQLLAAVKQQREDIIFLQNQVVKLSEQVQGKEAA